MEFAVYLSCLDAKFGPWTHCSLMNQVIYGDTDSIMIYSGLDDIGKSKAIAAKVIQEVGIGPLGPPENSCIVEASCELISLSYDGICTFYLFFTCKTFFIVLV